MSIETDLSYLQSLGATNGVLFSISEDTKDDFVVTELPFFELSQSLDTSFTVSVSFGGNSVNISIRKNLSDNEWWIVEEGSVSGESVNFVQRFTLNSFMHKYAPYTYVIVSPYEYNSDDEKLARQCIANSSLLVKY